MTVVTTADTSQLYALAARHGLKLHGPLTVNELGLDYRIVIATVDDGRRWVLRIPRRAEVSAKVEPEAREMEIRRGKALSEQRGLSDGNPGGPLTFVWNDENKAQARHNIDARLPALLAIWGPIIGREPTHITLRIMTSRWGSCTPRTGRIRLNLQLGLMNPKFLEYVLVHEMTHLWENGHGAGFQRRMDAYLPQWRQLRRDINRHVVL